MEKYLIPNLRNACQLLKVLAQGDSKRVSDLARVLDIPATSALRIVRTLELEGFLRKDHGELRLGPSLIYLGTAALGDTEIRHEAMPVLQTLARETDETAHIAVPCDGRSLIVAVCDSPHPLRAASRPGAITDLHCSSTGKVFLAFLHYDQLDEVIGRRPLAKRTDHTIVSAAALRKEIEATRKRGYSIDNEEIHPGVRCLAAPVTGADGSVVAAIGITAAAARFSPKRNEAISTHVLSAAAELSRRLGHISS
jgi:DNA-binding IclR family transcriptional regulator